MSAYGSAVPECWGARVPYGADDVLPLCWVLRAGCQHRAGASHQEDELGRCEEKGRAGIRTSRGCREAPAAPPGPAELPALLQCLHSSVSFCQLISAAQPRLPPLSNHKSLQQRPPVPAIRSAAAQRGSCATELGSAVPLSAVCSGGGGSPATPGSNGPSPDPEPLPHSLPSTPGDARSTEQSMARRGAGSPLLLQLSLLLLLSPSGEWGSVPGWDRAALPDARLFPPRGPMQERGPSILHATELTHFLACRDPAEWSRAGLRLSGRGRSSGANGVSRHRVVHHPPGAVPGAGGWAATHLLAAGQRADGWEAAPRRGGHRGVRAESAAAQPPTGQAVVLRGVERHQAAGRRGRDPSGL